MAARRDVIVAGASAGGVEALSAMVAGLPADFPGVVLVVLHLPRHGPSALPAILDRAGPLDVSTARDGEALEPGHIHVAPNDHHLLIADGRVRVTHGPAENGHRPAVDLLFRSAARAFGRRVAGVVLSGSGDDGAAGLATVVDRGGVGLVQDPADAVYPWMPQAAMGVVSPEYVVPAVKLGGLIAEITAMELPELPPTDRAGPPDEQALALEGALWMALRALEEKSALNRRMAVGHRTNASGARFSEMAEEADAAGETIRRLINQLSASAHPAEG